MEAPTVVSCTTDCGTRCTPFRSGGRCHVAPSLVYLALCVRLAVPSEAQGQLSFSFFSLFCFVFVFLYRVCVIFPCVRFHFLIFLLP